MKKEEAKQFVIDELKKGTGELEIKGYLLAEEKIGVENTTNDVVDKIYELAKSEFDLKYTNISNEFINDVQKSIDTGAYKIENNENTKIEKSINGKSLYEQWRVEIGSGSKISKVKDVMLSKDMAERLNLANITRAVI